MKRVLFVCSRNRLRSPTAEAVFRGHPQLEVDSAGLTHDAEQPLTPDLVAWAEVIFVMERAHLRKLRARFGRHLGGCRVVSLDIPDTYAFMDPALVEILEARVPPLLGLSVR